MFKKKKIFTGSAFLKAEHDLIQQYLANIIPDPKARLDYFEAVRPATTTEQARKLLKAIYERNEWVICNSIALSNRQYNAGEPSYELHRKLERLAFAILKGDVFPHLRLEGLLEEDDYLLYLDNVIQNRLNVWSSLEITLHHLRALAAKGPVSEIVFECTIKVYERLAQDRKLILQQEEIYFLCKAAKPPMIYTTDDHWGQVVLSDLRSLSGELQDRWSVLLTLCQTAYVSKPSGRWKKEALAFIEALGVEHFREMVTRWFSLVGVRGNADNDHILSLRNQDMLRGLAWCTALVPNADVTRALGQLAKICFSRTKFIEDELTEYMQLSVPLGNATVYALGAIESEAALTELSSVQLVANSKSARNALGKALQMSAESLNISLDELAEVAVPSYGLNRVGELRLDIDGFAAFLKITEHGNVEVQWHQQTGVVQKSPPKKLKEDYPEIVKEFKQAKKDIEKMLPAQTARLERLLYSKRHWHFEKWNSLYCAHPLVGVLSRRLIWVFTVGEVSRSAILINDVFVDCHESEIDASFLQQSTVNLWHPASEDLLASVNKWREFIQLRGVQQPFKQAHRELYRAAPNELSDGYCLRFSNHILRQVVFRSLCDARHWEYSLRVINDGSYKPASINLVDYGIRAEYFVECIADEEDALGSTVELMASGALVFFALDAPSNYQTVWDRIMATHVDRRQDAIPLSDVPATVLSEVMRDVDLFVSRASIGMDVNADDRNGEAQHQAYKDSVAFADFSEQAKIRQELLEWLIPRLPISDQLAVNGNFLEVTGRIRKYKIHLSSANVMLADSDLQLMLPNMAKKSDAVVVLPFQGDARLTQIINRAYYLANDTIIKDPSILNQLPQ